jgi:DNA polymerase III delta prime subunit
MTSEHPSHNNQQQAAPSTTFDQDGQIIDRDQYNAGRDIIINQPPAAPAPADEASTIHPRLRADLLRTLTSLVQRRLNDTLAKHVKLELGLQDAPTAVSPTWRANVRGTVSTRDIPPHTPIIDIFEQEGRELLILGAPGAGKTTLLLELAQALLIQSHADEQQPIPVVLNLASWGTKALPLEQWLIQALSDYAQVSRRFATQLIEGRHLLLLLDGLDEVAESKQAACIDAINTYYAQHKPLPIAVCSRSRDYARMGRQLALSSAVTIEPLELSQVIAALQQAGPHTARVCEALQTDRMLQELVTAPLMLNVTLLVYTRGAESTEQATTVEERRRILFDAYVARQFERQGHEMPYPQEHALRWLSWLAHSMNQEDQSEFLVEHMQPTLLDSVRTYQRMSRLIYGLFGGLGIGLLMSLAFGLVWGLIFCLIIGSMFVFVFARRSEIVLSESLRWSWHSVWQRLPVNLFFGLFAGLSTSLIAWFIYGQNANLATMVVFGLIFGLCLGLVFAVGDGFVPVELQEVLQPNQGIKGSLRSVLIFGLVFGIVGGLVFGLIFGLFLGLGGGLVFGLVSGLGGVLGGLLVGSLKKGGDAVVKHYTLRLLLWRQGAIPLQYVRFLNAASRLLLLQRTGGNYRFRHRMLLEYFAEQEENR